MVNQKLVDLIFSKKKIGADLYNLYYSLVRQGYNHHEVVEAINYVNKHPLSSPIKLKLKKYMIIIPIILFIIIGAVLSFYVFNDKSECGDGIIDEGETYETCCLDVSCLGAQSCTDNVCVDPICGDCQYLRNHDCIDYICCVDEDCSVKEICEDNQCKQIICGDCQFINNKICIDYECCLDSDCGINQECRNHYCYESYAKLCGDCQYLENDLCIDFECCYDSDCNDYDENTEDMCNNPSTKEAYCKSIEYYQCSSSDDCDDGDNSTKDVCGRGPKICYNVNITECKAGDDYCPPGCYFFNDYDCNVTEVDCGYDFDCFTDAAEFCGPATCKRNYRGELLGFIDMIRQNFTIKNESGDCRYISMIEYKNFSLTEDMKDFYRDNNLTEEEIDEVEEEAYNNSHFLLGTGTFCIFDSTSDLISILEKIDRGTIYTNLTCNLINCTVGGDWEIADCEQITN